MTRKLLLCLSALLSFGFAQASLAAGDPAAGKARVAACGACHGPQGASSAPNFPNLAGIGEKYLLKQLRDIQSGRRQVAEMTGQLNGLSEQDLADIAAFYAGQPRQWAGAKDVPASLALGEKIYRAGNPETGVAACTGCHSPVGNGNAPAGYPALGGQQADYLAKQLRAFRDAAHDPSWPGARNNDENAVMRGVAAHLNDQEIAALANFIAGLK
ncbi:MAG: c-type cytochrome [Pseudomonadota bacterium]|jgi:cytochrome c553